MKAMLVPGYDGVFEDAERGHGLGDEVRVPAMAAQVLVGYLDLVEVNVVDFVAPGDVLDCPV
jgi:hypothetical protein